jgi:hypothetical protein
MGERSAGNPHAAFDVAGAGNVAWAECFDPNRRASPRPYHGRGGRGLAGGAAHHGFGAQIRLWPCGGSWGPFQAIRCDIGMPRRVFRFSTEQATLVSVFWAGRVRARRLLPMMALKRNMAVSACDRLP